MEPTARGARPERSRQLGAAPPDVAAAHRADRPWPSDRAFGHRADSPRRPSGRRRPCGRSAHDPPRCDRRRDETRQHGACARCDLVGHRQHALACGGCSGSAGAAHPGAARSPDRRLRLGFGVARPRRRPTQRAAQAALSGAFPHRRHRLGRRHPDRRSASLALAGQTWINLFSGWRSANFSRGRPRSQRRASTSPVPPVC